MTSALNIFVDDDDRDFARSLCILLEVEGYRAGLAFSGREAVREFRAHDFDLTFLDMRLPDMNGFECLRQLRQIRRDAKVLMMTAYGVRELTTQARAAGALGVLSKPLDVDDLLVALKAADERVVLVADDDAGFVDIMVEMLAGKGYRVLVAQNGDEAVEKVLRNKVDVMILDARMPRMSGVEVLSQLQRHGRMIPTVVVSGHVPQELGAIEEPSVMSVTRCLAKPFRLKDILGTIEAMVKPPDGDRDFANGRHDRLALEGYDVAEPYHTAHGPGTCERLEESLGRKEEELERPTLTDPLSGLPDRRRFQRRPSPQRKAARKRNQPPDLESC